MSCKRLIQRMLFVGINLFPALLFAEGNFLRVPQGATSRDVVLILGEPHEQIEHETRREDVWFYPEGRLIFKRGKVQALYPFGAQKNFFETEKALKADIVKASAEKASANSAQDILSEILNEVPSEGGSDSTDPMAERRPTEVIGDIRPR